MANTGTWLENLVRQIEEFLLPQGFTVSVNDKVYNDDGIQIAEFDIEIVGRLGSTEIKWLIECRDRPAHGAAPASWIEQLVGRRDRFHFDKVTAVSTTGFAPGAIEYARTAAIETRTVSELTPRDVTQWFGMSHVPILERHIELKIIKFNFSEQESNDRKEAVRYLLQTAGPNPRILKTNQTVTCLTPVEAFNRVLSRDHQLDNALNQVAPEEEIEVTIDYPTPEEPFLISTMAGDVPVCQLVFIGNVKRIEKQFPISRISEYRRDLSGRLISQSIEFDLSLRDLGLRLEFHRLADTGSTHIVLRNITKKK